MTVDEALVTHLVADTALKAVISTRVWAVALDQRPTLPAVTYTRIDVTPEHDRSSKRADIARTRYQFDCYATTYDGARAVAVLLKDALATFVEASGPTISHALALSEFDINEPETGRWRSVLDAYVYHEE